MSNVADFPEAAPGRPLRILSLDEIAQLAPPSYLVDKLIPTGGMAVMYGDWGTGKSFVALDIELRIAYGLDWHGRAAAQGNVAYLAGEGVAGMKTRIQGWQEFNGKAGLAAAFRLIPESIPFLDLAEVRNLVWRIRNEYGPIDLLVADTLARLFGPGDESSTKDMNRFVDACDIIRDELDCAILVVHHEGKDATRGTRGSIALPGGADAVVKCTKTNDIVVLEVEKQKDDEKLPPVGLDLRSVSVVDPVSGETLWTKVPVKSTAAPPSSKNAAPKLNPNQTTVLHLLEDAGPAGLTSAEWLAAAREQGIAVKRKQTFYEVVRKLISGKDPLVETIGGVYSAMSCRE